MKESIKNKVREIQDKYCGESVETKLYYAIKETEDLQVAYNIAMLEINRLRKLLGYDSPSKPKAKGCGKDIKMYFDSEHEEKGFTTEKCQKNIKCKECSQSD